MTPLIICADDYGQSSAIDAGIIDLITQQRLTATSCLTLSPRWLQAAKLLTHDIQKHADIGLHLDFTQFGQPQHSLRALIVRAISHSLPRKAIQESITTQLNRFEDSLDKAPDYIDGHQHVHQLPQIRDALLEAIAQRYGNKLPWLRIASPPRHTGLKAWVIRSLGAKKLDSGARKLGLRCSENLLGVYAFDGSTESYMERLTGWLAGAKHSDSVCVLMCHPAKPLSPGGDEINDPIYYARLREFEVFSSPDFPMLLEQYGIHLARGNTISN
ncbi:MAG TPA: ChbG/HpnK family deacetylase [Methylophilaceae bacterium]|jgi:predicted glycoside hydrolase/deacetylase ChbG (UPF0249 family)